MAAYRIYLTNLTYIPANDSHCQSLANTLYLNGFLDLIQRFFIDSCPNEDISNLTMDYLLINE